MEKKINTQTSKAVCISSTRLPKSLELADFASLHGRVGIFGGSFDPIHNGHLQLAQRAKEDLKLDAIVFIPAKQNPLKDKKPTLDHLRLEMILAAINEIDGFYVSPMEFQKQEKSFSYQTVSEINSVLPEDSKLFMLVGSDCLLDFHRWHRAHELIKLTELAVMRRDGNLSMVNMIENLMKNFSPKEIERMTRNILEPVEQISSTQIREQVSKGNIFSTSLPNSVKSIIIQNSLYI